MELALILIVLAVVAYMAVSDVPKDTSNASKPTNVASTPVNKCSGMAKLVDRRKVEQAMAKLRKFYSLPPHKQAEAYLRRKNPPLSHPTTMLFIGGLLEYKEEVYTHYLFDTDYAVNECWVDTPLEDAPDYVTAGGVKVFDFMRTLSTLLYGEHWRKGYGSHYHDRVLRDFISYTDDLLLN